MSNALDGYSELYNKLVDAQSVVMENPVPSKHLGYIPQGNGNLKYVVFGGLGFIGFRV